MRALVAAAILVAALSGCRSAPETPPVPTRPAGERAEAPPVDPGSFDQVTALAVGERVVFLGGESGLVRLDPSTGAYLLLPEAEGASSGGVSAVALAPDGTLWSAHRTELSAAAGSAPRRGGLRALAPGEGRPRAWFAEDGLGTDDLAALAVSGRRVVVAAGEGLAELRLDAAVPSFARGFEAASRTVEVVSFDEEGATLRQVREFRPRGERVLAVALAEPRLWIGTTHGLFRREGAALRRYEIPCRVDGRPPRRVHALAAKDGGVVAVLGLDLGGGEWRAGGLLELEEAGAWRCHVPNLDVPDSPALQVGEAGGTTWLATYEGPTRIRGSEAELLDAAAGAPDLPATAVAVPAPSSVWFGTWGGGAWHLAEREWTAYSLPGELRGTAVVRRGSLR